ncbi:MAG: hemerythrin domain-containing protein [Candidatus Cybelea sp.]
MDVLTLLKNDHKTVGGLLNQAKKCEPGDGRLAALAEQIESALTVHAAIEEKYFYPRLHERSDEADDVVDVFEAYTEHELIKKLISLLKSGRQPDEQFKAELQVLAENVEHHVKEEESTIFALARETLDAEELEELGAEMEAAKNKMMSRSSRAPKRNAPAKKSSKKKAVSREGRR